MWRDEIHAFTLAAASATPVDVLRALHYEAHPGLWHALLWLLTRLTADPHWMQVLQLSIGLATWAVIARYAPFTVVEKLLLLLGYFLVWEYFVLARNYGLGALLGFSAIALRERAPRNSTLPWLALGLLANTSVFGTLWSAGLAVGLVADPDRTRRTWVTGGAVYLALALFAILTMVPAADMRYRPPDPPRDVGLLADAAAYPRGAFMPRQLAVQTTPFFGAPAPANDPSPVAAAQAEAASVVSRVLWLLAPLGLALLILRRRRFVVEFLVTYAGTIAFATLFAVQGSARHHGILFLAMVGAAWGARARSPPAARPPAAWLAVLAVSALAGLASVAFDLRPYSHAEDVARWLRRHDLADGFIVGWRDMPASTVAGYLGRPIYHLECGCERRYVVWNTQRRDVVDEADLAARLEAALVHARVDEAIVIVSQPRTLAPGEAMPGLAVEQLARFRGAVMREEDFTIYRVRRTTDRLPPARQGGADGHG